MNYRRDRRSLDAFKADIKNGALAERQIIERWLQTVEKETGNRPKFTDNGCDNSGEYLEDRDVSLEPDFYVDGYGFIEVKFSYPKLRGRFHLKTDQVVYYLRNNTTILFADGWRTDSPVFTVIVPSELEKLVNGQNTIKFDGFGGKDAYRISTDRLTWQPFLST
jgi:hypothetical protein